MQRPWKSIPDPDPRCGATELPVTETCGRALDHERQDVGRPIASDVVLLKPADGPQPGTTVRALGLHRMLEQPACAPRAA